MQFTETDILLMQTYLYENKMKEMEAQSILNAKYIAKLFGDDK